MSDSRPWQVRTAYCSCCLAETDHRLEQDGAVGRYKYRCEGCGASTVVCAAVGCTHMATLARTRDGGSRWWCAEHNGDIASFANLEVKLADLAEWNDFFKRDSINYASATKTTLVAGSLAALIIPVGVLFAPALAARLGALGLLGAASTGTEIVSLSGAALKSASLAYIGGVAAKGGGMALGTLLIAAGSAALGARVGGGVAHAYFREVDRYAVLKLRDAAAPRTRGRRKTVVFVNGWLQEADKEFAAWQRGTKAQYGNAAAYGVTWESGRPVETLTKAGSLGTAVTATLAGLTVATRAFLPAAVAEAIRFVLANPWHVAFHKSGKVGVLNAEMLLRHTGPPVTLMGHSLGARTILYTLLTLAERVEKPIVRDVYLFGGAADSERKDWGQAAKAVGGTIYNFHSDRDDVLGKALRIASAGFTKPIGTTPICSTARNIVNFDCSDLVGGHDDYKPNLQELLSRARRAGRI